MCLGGKVILALKKKSHMYVMMVVPEFYSLILVGLKQRVFLNYGYACVNFQHSDIALLVDLT